MAFRDDRDAQLARAAALERENRRLEEELERHKAEAAAAAEAIAAAEARGREAGERKRRGRAKERQAELAKENTELREELKRAREAGDREQERRAKERQAKLAEENAELREELARARGPGVLRRAAMWIAGLRLAEPSGDGGYWRTALEAWRIYAPIVAGLLITALFLGTRAVQLALLVPVAAAALAAVVLSIPWLLRRRRRDVAGGIAGAAIGPMASLAILDRMANGGVPTSMYLTVGLVVVALAGMAMTRALTSKLAFVLCLFVSPLLALPTHAHLVVWMALAIAGSELAQAPGASRARR